MVRHVAVARAVGRAPVGTRGDHVARDPPLVLAHVRQQGAAADVADRVQPITATDDCHVIVG